MNTIDITAYLSAMWTRFFDFLPQLITAIIILVIGWLVAYALAAVVRSLVRYSGLDRWVERARLNHRLSIEEGSKYAFASNLAASLVKWIVMIVTLGFAADVLGLPGVRAFIGTILAYIPNVIVAVVILAIGIVASQIVSEFIAIGEMMLDISPRAKRALSQVAKYAIIVFSIMAALIQLNIVPQLIEIAFAGLVFALALSFGLGGREQASRWIADLQSRA
jgi:hypothetical protein